jgi:acetoacetyl-CoA synthetase
MRAQVEPDPPVLWEPPPERVAAANITRYLAWLEETRGLRFADFEALWRWSVEELEDFWASIWDYFEIEASAPYERVLGRREMPGAEWFTSARLSFPQHVFADKDDTEVAIRHASELRSLGEWTYGHLRAQAAGFAAGLRAAGVEAGDRVVAYMPNIPETIAAFLGCASIGAIWSSCSPEFGVRSAVDRFGQIEPKLLVTVDGYRYGGKDLSRLDAITELQRELPSLRETVLLRYLDADASLPDSVAWDEFTNASAAQLEFAQLPFDHPLWVLYSSGTTGLPKPIVQSHGGILLEQLMWLTLHADCREGDRFFWFSTTGWVMWNVTLSVLLTRASIVLYDGSPGHPDLGVLWDLAQNAGVTCFGTSAAYIGQCQKQGLEPRAGRDLSALTGIGSTGSPLSPEGFAWVYEALGNDIWLFSTSGGTDMAGPLLCGAPTLPVREGELAARALGAAVASFDGDGRPVVGEVGELVVTEPIPSMPLYLWGDDDGSRYRESYFDMYPGVWRHGDWVMITPRGSGIIYGRSDATINRGGVRMGTSEIYRSVLALPEVLDTLVVDLSGPGREGFMPLFVVLAPGAELTEELKGTIRARIRSDCSPRHVPNEIHAVADVPRTLTGKILEVPVKRILMGEAPEMVTSRDSLANPGALDWFIDCRERINPALTGPTRPPAQETSLRPPPIADAP